MIAAINLAIDLIERRGALAAGQAKGGD